MRALLCASVIWISACGKRPSGPAADPAAVLAEARARDLPFALRGAFSVTIRRGEAELGTRGGLVLHEPDRFRVEILGPVGTPALIVASDGRAIDVWNAQDQIFYHGPDAASVLAELTGGAVGLSDVVRVLTASLPLPDAPVRSATMEDGALALALAGAEGVDVLARVDAKTGLLAELSVQRDGERLVHLAYGESKKVGRVRLPWLMSLEIPSLSLGLELDVVSWDELGQVPEVFRLTPPAGATEKDLVSSLREAAEKAGRPRP